MGGEQSWEQRRRDSQREQLCFHSCFSKSDVTKWKRGLLGTTLLLTEHILHHVHSVHSDCLTDMHHIQHCLIYTNSASVFAQEFISTYYFYLIIFIQRNIDMHLQKIPIISLMFYAFGSLSRAYKCPSCPVLKWETSQGQHPLFLTNLTYSPSI